MRLIDEDLKQYEGVVLGGCAILGISHLGFLESLIYNNKLKYLKVFAGTSVGSIIGFLYVCGFSIKEILFQLTGKNMFDLLQINNVNDISTKKGFLNSDLIIAQIVDILLSKTIDPEITFSELYKINKIKFIVTASRYEDNPPCLKPEYFSVDTAPDMSVIDSIKLSICIPLFFAISKYRDNFYVDGGLSDDMPFTYIKNKYNIDTQYIIGHTASSQQNSFNENGKPTTMLTYMNYLIDFLVRSTQETSSKDYRDRIITTYVNLPVFTKEITEDYLRYSYYLGIKHTTKYLNHKLSHTLSRPIEISDI